MLDLLEDDDDVQEVYHNAEFPEGWKDKINQNSKGIIRK